MKTTQPLPRHPKPIPSSDRNWPLLLLLALGAASAGSALAEVVVVESRTGSAVTAFPPYGEATGSWGNSTLKSSAAGTTGTRGGSRYIQAPSPAPAFKIQPTLLEAGGTYYVEVTHGSAASVSADLIVGITTVNGSGLPATTDGFQQTKGVNAWYRIGTLVLEPGQTAPTITFTYQGGTLNTTGPSRFYADAIRFINTNTICITGLPELSVVNGPLAAGQTSVDVAGVTNAATNVSVYADGVLIGEKFADIVAGVNTVTTSPLLKGQQITVSQWANGIESCRPVIGTLIGGGANPRVRVALSIRQNTALTGPIGADGGLTGNKLVFLGSSNVVAGGYGNAPSEGKVIIPSACWQTVTFLRGPNPASPVDPTYAWANSDGNQLAGDFGVLEAIAFAIDDLTDTGPFRIYLDTVMNGSTLIQDFESATNGEQSVLFSQPSASGSTTPFLLAPSPGSISPNISQVSNENADAGTNSAVVSWQFKDVAPANWLRLLTQGSNTPNPQVDLRLPISFRILLLPVGETVGNPSVNIITQPTGVNASLEDDVFFTVAATGVEPIIYQWQHDGVDMPEATYPVLEILPVQLTDVGSYTCVVSGPSCTVTSQVATLGLVGTGNGLSGQYYSNQDKTFNNPPTLIRLDPAVDFTWTTGSPDPSISADRFTVRWAGQVEPFTSETYTFYTTTDDGVRLWVNGVLLIDKWIDQSATEWSGSIALTVGQKYDLVMEFYENGGDATAVLRWSSAGEPKSVIPMSQLYTVAPTITSEPLSRTNEAGSSVTFNVVAEGTWPSYQWLKNGTPVPGANSNSYTTDPVLCTDAGDYTVRVSNGAGSVGSAVATLTVNPSLLTASGPVDQPVKSGGNVTLSTTVSGAAPIRYIWRKDGTELTGQTSNSMTISAATELDAGVYCVEVTGPCNSVTNCAKLTVVVPPILGEVVFDSAAGAFKFTFATAPGQTYVVEYNNDVEGPMWTLLQTITGDGNPVTITDNTDLPAKRFYRVRVSRP